MTIRNAMTNNFPKNRILNNSMNGKVKILDKGLLWSNLTTLRDVVLLARKPLVAFLIFHTFVYDFREVAPTCLAKY